jgi:multiple sugar transport system permease protein
MTTEKSVAVKKRRHVFDEDNRTGYLLLSPWLLGFFVFTVYPLFSSLFFSFTKFDLLSSPQWVGLQNFKNIFLDTRFYQSMKVTFIYVLVHVPLKLIFALCVAMIFNMKHAGQSVYRAVYYLPSIVGGSIAISVMWVELFASQGPFNAILGHLGLTVTRNWIGDPNTSLAMIIVLAIWQFGSPMLIFLAGLKQIPATYYEAAEMDGAGAFKKFAHITLPSLSPVIFFNLLMQVIGAFMAFTQCYIVSNGTGGPSDTTLFYALYIYLEGIKYYKMGYACALAWIMVIIIGAITALLFKTSDKWVFSESK